MQQIKERLSEQLANDLVFNPDGSTVKPATVIENAPLALVQLNVETIVSTLKWVLKD